MNEQYEVLAVRYGTRQASAAEVFLNFHAYHEPDRPLGMDYFFWVARSPARTVVIDTGFSPAGGAARGRTMLMDTVPALRAAGTAPDDVAQVVLTHAHYDHIGGLPVFTTAEVIMTRDEYDFWTGPMGRRGQFAHTTDSSEIGHLRELREAGRPDPGRASLYRVAPGLELTQVGGHTPGQAIVTVAAAGGAGRPGLGRGPLLRGAGTGPAVLHRGEPRGHVRRLRPHPRDGRGRRPRGRRA